MRTLVAALALAALAAACTDQPTNPLVPEPQLAKVEAPQMAKGGGGNGAMIVNWSLESGFCWFFDADENYVPAPCQIVYRKNDTLTWRIYGAGIYNPTGKALHFGPTHYPQAMADFYRDFFDVEPVDGKMPMCDYDILTDPSIEWLICSTNWHYTISASGEGTFIWIADPGHSWTKYFPLPSF